MRRLYSRLAPHYDVVVLPSRVLGAQRHRERAVQSLDLKPGNVVLDLGCGTGLNFPILHRRVGSDGRIIGVDLTPAMLERARNRALAAGFENVELVEANLASYVIPEGVSAAIATYVLEAVPEYDSVVESLARSLPLGGRLVSYGLKHPEDWPEWLVSAGILLTRSFGVSRDYESFQPWKSVRRHFFEVDYEEFLWGAAYLSVGECR